MLWKDNVNYRSTVIVLKIEKVISSNVVLELSTRRYTTQFRDRFENVITEIICPFFLFG